MNVSFSLGTNGAADFSRWELFWEQRSPDGDSNESVRQDHYQFLNGWIDKSKEELQPLQWQVDNDKNKILLGGFITELKQMIDQVYSLNETKIDKWIKNKKDSNGNRMDHTKLS